MLSLFNFSPKTKKSIIETLLKGGATASLNTTDDKGKTALDYARESGDKEVIELLEHVTLNNKKTTPTVPTIKLLKKDFYDR